MSFGPCAHGKSALRPSVLTGWFTFVTHCTVDLRAAYVESTEKNPAFENAMNELSHITLDPLRGRLPTHRDITLPELFAAYGVSNRTTNALQQDQPDVWKTGHLPVIPGDYRMYVRDACLENPLIDPEYWMNLRQLGMTTVLVPNFAFEAPEHEWSIMMFDRTRQAVRPVIFNTETYVGTFQPALPCIPDRGECVSNTCTGRDHTCTKYRGDSQDKGGQYFWCECEASS